MTYCQYLGIGNKARIMAPNVCVSSYDSNIPLRFFATAGFQEKKMSFQINRKCNNLPYYLLPGAVIELQISDPPIEDKCIFTCTLKSLTLEATPSVAQFSKRAYKISHPPRLKASQVALPSFTAF